MYELYVPNQNALEDFKSAVKTVETWEHIRHEIFDKSECDFSAKHISEVLNGRKRPSYQLAEALIKIANENIKKQSTKKWSKVFKKNGINIKAKKFNLRNLPVAKYKGSTHEYFERTPSYPHSYNTTQFHRSMANIADRFGVTERTLQKYVCGALHIPENWSSEKAPFSLNGKAITKKQVVLKIREATG